MYERIRTHPTVTLGELPPGDLGTYKTLSLMQKAVREGMADVRVRETAVSLVRSAGVMAQDGLGAARALFNFVRDRIYFVPDPVNIQLIQGARYTLEQRSGNCAQKAILLATLLKSVGIPARFRAIGASSRAPEAFSHVYVVAELARKLIPLDATFPNNEMGWEVPNPTRFAEVPA